LALGLALLAFVRVGTWGDPVVLWGNEVERDPSRAPALIHLAGALAERGQHEQALEANSRAAAIAEAAGQGRLEAIARTNIAGLVSIHFDRADRALTELERAVAADPGYADAYVAAGVIHAGDRRWSAAEQAFRRGLTHGPWNTAAATGLAGALAARGSIDEALEILAQARRRAAGSPEILASVERKIDLVEALRQ